MFIIEPGRKGCFDFVIYRTIDELAKIHLTIGIINGFGGDEVVPWVKNTSPNSVVEGENQLVQIVL